MRQKKNPAAQLDVLNVRENSFCSAPGSCQATGGPESHRVTAGYQSNDDDLYPNTRSQPFSVKAERSQRLWTYVFPVFRGSKW